MNFSQRAHLFGVICDKSWLYIMMLTTATKNLVNELANTHTIINFNVKSNRCCSQFFFTHPTNIDTSMLLNRLENRDTRIGRFEIDSLITNLHFCRVVCVDGNLFEQSLCCFHHPVIIFIGDIKLHDSKLGVVCSVHTFVAKVFGKFINTIKPPNNKTF